MQKWRILRLKNLMIFFVLVAGVLIEGGRALWTWRALQQAATRGVRYAATQTWIPEYGPSTCETRTQQNTARLPSIHTTIRRALHKDVFGSDRIGLRSINSDDINIVVCSDHQGYLYSAEYNRCFPYEYPGDAEENVIVSVRYDYPLNTWFGDKALTFPFRVNDEARVEWVGPAQVVGIRSGPGFYFPMPEAPNFSAVIQVEPVKKIMLFTAELQVLASNTEASLTQVNETVSALDGQMTTTHWVAGEPDHIYAKLLIPRAEFETVTSQIDSQATSMIYETIESEDVTLEYNGMLGDLAIWRAYADYLEQQMAGAETQREMHRIQADLEEAQAKITSLLERKQTWDAQADTVTINLWLTPEPTPLEPPPNQPTTLQIILAILSNILISGLLAGVPLAVLVWGLLEMVRDKSRI